MTRVTLFTVQKPFDGINNTLSYDAAGNITGYVPAAGDDISIEYDVRNQAKKITLGTTPTAEDTFWYDAEGDRYLKKSTWLDDTVTRQSWTLYLAGGQYEVSFPVSEPGVIRRDKISVTDAIEYTTTVPLSGGVVDTVTYKHRDHLGSVSVITDSSGNVLTDASSNDIGHRAFDPFGGRRSKNWDSDIGSAGLQLIEASTEPTARGFTNHEHLDRIGFIHMNGRVFDPRIGRFLQPDPYVPSPLFSQSYNRYSYVNNNPLSYTDPSGFVNDGGNDGGVFEFGTKKTESGRYNESYAKEEKSIRNEDRIARQNSQIRGSAERLVRSNVPRDTPLGTNMSNPEGRPEPGDGGIQVNANPGGDAQQGNIVDYTNADGERFVVTADGTAISYFSDGRIGAVVPPNADINRFLIDTVTGGAAAALLGSQIRVARLVPRGLPTEINSQLQARHASGTVGRRSPLLKGVDAQALLDGVHSGAYNVLRINQRGYPVVDFGGPIGMYRGQQTQFGTIHFGKNGAHIVPANPVQY